MNLQCVSVDVNESVQMTGVIIHDGEGKRSIGTVRSQMLLTVGLPRIEVELSTNTESTDAVVPAEEKLLEIQSTKITNI